jgi:hypothetical protein
MTLLTLPVGPDETGNGTDEKSSSAMQVLAVCGRHLARSNHRPVLRALRDRHKRRHVENLVPPVGFKWAYEIRFSAPCACQREICTVNHQSNIISN